MQDKILIVEDDQEISQVLAIYMKNQGYVPYLAFDGVQALQLCEKYSIDLAVVDVMMPKMDGISFIMRIRETQSFPIIIVSAKTEDLDKITGLNVGADDYVSKPFVPMELMARIKAQLRRYHHYSKKEEMTSAGSYQVRGLELNSETKEVMVDGALIHLTPIEFRILELLIQSPGRVFSAQQIYEQVWKEEAVNTETVMVHIRNLREKIEVNPRKPQYLKVVWGIGYKIEK
ncbi:response regulator transcription factor [Merdibacter massiliensis]|uniref:response regulator transcription factor n=1 Tax=Merdibacter massiliensis TaxID=1871030 RepID=UPI00096A6A1C|nr:response regulator transcription factor [Merdibacter massiliensis]